MILQMHIINFWQLWLGETCTSRLPSDSLSPFVDIFCLDLDIVRNAAIFPTMFTKDTCLKH